MKIFNEKYRPTYSIYRPEIDGLRAIAIILVLSFHFFPEYMPYGFIGVDLFFVISGYLIVQQIYQEIQKGEFSFIDFILRRFKRIFPLLSIAVTATLIAGFLIMLPKDFEKLSTSAFSVLTMWSNVFYWRDGGYFSSADKLKPLLHMWSLSVEQQFYIFSAIFMSLLSKNGSVWRKWWVILLCISTLTAISFFVYVALHVIGGDTPAFFLSPSRAWQFGAGGIMAIWTSKIKHAGSSFLSLSSIVSVIFLGILGLTSYATNVIIVFLGCLYLLSAESRGITYRVMSSSWMRYIGTRSFSLYVWHWPIIAYLNYIFVDGISFKFLITGIFLSIILSEISFHLIEVPFRKLYPATMTFGLLCVSVGVGTFIYITSTSQPQSGFTNALSSQIQTNFRCEISDFIPYGASRACLLGDPELPRDIALLGNSHAQMYAEAVSAYANDKGSSIILVPLNGCLPTPTLNISESCSSNALENLNSVLNDASITTVIIATTYPDGGLQGPNGVIAAPEIAPALEQALLELINTLEINDRRTLLIGPLLTPGFDIPSELARRLRFNLLTETEAIETMVAPREEFDVRFGSLVLALQRRLGDDFLRPDTMFCDTNFCYYGDEGGSYFADPSHLGAYGVSRVESLFRNF